MTHRPERQPLKICIVVPYDLSQPGGGVKHHAFELAKALREAGDEVTILGPASLPVQTDEVVGLPGVSNTPLTASLFPPFGGSRMAPPAPVSNSEGSVQAASAGGGIDNWLINRLFGRR